jgi:hypothetical protein
MVFIYLERLAFATRARHWTRSESSTGFFEYIGSRRAAPDPKVLLVCKFNLAALSRESLFIYDEAKPVQSCVVAACATAGCWFGVGQITH